MTWRLAILIFSILLSAYSEAQEINNINPLIKIFVGDPFYIHEVLEGQTLEAIASAYNANLEAIKKENSALTDPLIIRINIRIPYTDESAARMMEVAAEMGLAETTGTKTKREKKKDQKAIEEATELLILEEEVKKPVPDADEEQIAILSELSKTLSEGLTDLEILQEEINEKPVLDKEGFQKEEVLLGEPKEAIEPKNTPVSAVIDDRLKLFKKEGESSLYLKEYFLLRVNPEGVVTNLRDERSETNSNTNFLDMNDIKGRYINDSIESFRGMIIPVGINAEVNRVRFHVKVKKGKIKIIEKSFPAEFQDSRQGYIDLIRSSKPVETLHGKFKVVILEGETFISIHDKFEYNPFGIISGTMDDRKLLELEEFSDY
ncbi:hypothetical protein N9545_08605 [Salibacteraceae bacterium]|nr:hypothetical protein [Salibacteraceae bacterium]MDB9709073.1 hypothetical protein [Salibacteraceae bacterium]MDC1304391.1 hypothetical protein [Salibacteraceae bacterium]